MRQQRLKRFARNLEALAAKDDKLLEQTRHTEEVRRAAALDLHRLCRRFVQEVNELLERVQVELSPPEFSPEDFRDSGPNLFQINARGRILQIEFEATDGLLSTDSFRTPYTLQGAIRYFNQELLERMEIQEHLLFFCPEGELGRWEGVESRARRSATLDEDYLLALMESLV